MIHSLNYNSRTDTSLVEVLRIESESVVFILLALDSDNISYAASGKHKEADKEDEEATVVSEPEGERLVWVVEAIDVYGLIEGVVLRVIDLRGRIVVLLADDIVWVFETNTDNVVVIGILVEWGLIENDIVVLKELCADGPGISGLTKIFGGVQFFDENANVAVSFVETKLFRLNQQVFTWDVHDILFRLKTSNSKLEIESSLLPYTHG